MVVCAACSFDVGDRSGRPCPRCGHLVDLELDLPPAEAAVARGTAPERAGISATSEISLELDAPAPGTANLVVDPLLAPLAPRSGDVGARADAKAPFLPRASGAAAALGSATIDATEARAYGDFGPTPVWYDAPAYALRVIRRRLELRDDATDRRARAAAAAVRLQSACVCFVSRVRPAIEASSRRALDAVVAAERRLAEVDPVLSAAHAEHLAKLGAHGGTLTAAIGVDERFLRDARLGAGDGSERGLAFEDVRRALADLGLRALADVDGVAAGHRSACTEAEAHVAAHARAVREASLSEAAATAYDRSAFRRGVVLVALSVAFVVTVVFGPLAYRAWFPAPPPDLHGDGEGQ